MEVCIDAYGYETYYIDGKTYSESEMFDVYNDYLDFKEKYDYTIYVNNDETFGHSVTRLVLVRDISGNEYYNSNDKYCTYNRRGNLISGSLFECMDAVIFDDMVKDIKLGNFA